MDFLKKKAGFAVVILGFVILIAVVWLSLFRYSKERERERDGVLVLGIPNQEEVFECRERV